MDDSQTFSWSQSDILWQFLLSKTSTSPIQISKIIITYMFYLTSFCLHFHNPNFFPLSPHCFQKLQVLDTIFKSFILQVDSCWANSCVIVNAFRYFSSSVRILDVWWAVVVKWIPITPSMTSIPPSLLLLFWYIRWYHQTLKVPYTDALLVYDDMVVL